jgi:putative endonuclease
MKDKQDYYVYIVECSDGSYYTGQTDNLKLRIKEHNGDYSKKGAAYTRSRRPVELRYFEILKTRSDAMKREYEIKQLKHIEKRALCSNGNITGV